MSEQGFIWLIIWFFWPRPGRCHRLLQKQYNFDHNTRWSLRLYGHWQFPTSTEHICSGPFRSIWWIDHCIQLRFQHRQWTWRSFPELIESNYFGTEVRRKWRSTIRWYPTNLPILNHQSFIQIYFINNNNLYKIPLQIFRCCLLETLYHLFRLCDSQSAGLHPMNRSKLYIFFH